MQTPTPSSTSTTSTQTSTSPIAPVSHSNSRDEVPSNTSLTDADVEETLEAEEEGIFFLQV